MLQMAKDDVKGKKRVVQNFDICGETQIELDSEVACVTN